MSKQNTFPRQISVRGAIHSALLASALAAGGVLPQATLAEKVDPTLYDQDTEQLLVYLQPEVKPDDLAKRYGLKPVRTLASGINAHVFTTDSVESAHKILPVLWADKTVKAAFNNQRVIRVPGSADPLYPPSGNGGLGQWHLYNDLGWPHIRAEGAWELGATGNKVVVGIVDSGVDPKHPDLSLAADLSFDFVDNNAESAPCMDTQQCSMGYHGTGVAGVAAAIGFNNLGGRGVAYRAQIADLRIPLANSYIGNIGYSQYVDRVVDAIHYSANEVTIKNHSYGDEFDANTVTDDPQSLFSSAENYAIQQTTADGMIHVKGAGNESTNWNRRKAANIPEQIVVTALGVHGRYASYSNYGAGVLVTAPSSDPKWDSNIGIATTTLTNIPFGDTWGYTTSFGGTSAAAPQVTGALALAKEIRPDLEVRLAKHLLVNSSRPIDLEDSSSRGGWTVNKAGCAFNPNYGFGLLDAERLVKLASDLNISRLSTWDITARSNGDHLPLAIPDYDAMPLTIEIMAEISTSDPFAGIRPDLTKRLEEVGVTVDIGHTRPGDVEVVLVSPGGTRSRLRFSHNDFHGFEDLPIRRTYWSNAFWGETPSGNWTLEIHDKVSGDSGRLNDYTLHLRMGSVTAPADFKVCAQHQEAFRL